MRVRRVAVVGAGWSGLACALELSLSGAEVVVLDAAPQPGGRARALRLRLGDREFKLDNGQHLLIGAYGETLRLMREVGVAPESALLRRPFEIRYPDGLLVQAGSMPPPLGLAAGLLAARGLGWRARLQPLAFALRWTLRRWRIGADAPAITLFSSAPPAIVQRLWRPLCLAALNVEPDEASAQRFLAVLRDSLAGGPGASDLLIPRFDLGRAFPEPAAATLARRGVEVRLSSPVQALRRDGAQWRLDSRGELLEADAVVLALPPRQAARLLASAGEPALEATCSQLRNIGASPIATVYLRYPAGTGLPHPAYALLDDADARRFGQWVFDRGRLDEANSGVLSVVISAAAARALNGERLVAAVAAQLTADFRLPAPLAGAAIIEKQATILPAPGLQRPATVLPLPGLFLAGDAAANEYPSTLEGSVRAGIAAARAVVASSLA